MGYFTNAGSAKGIIKWGQLSGSIGVLDTPDSQIQVGIAHPVGYTGKGVATWRLHIHDADLPGEWVIIDRKFVSVDDT